MNDIHWQKLVHHVAVEALALGKAGRDPNEACLIRSQDDKSWRYTQTAKITLDGATGKAIVAFKTDKAEQTFMSAIAEAASKDGDAEVQAGEGQTGSERLLQTLRGVVDQSITPELLNDKAWMTVPIKDPLIKLAVRHTHSSSHDRNILTLNRLTNA